MQEPRIIYMGTPDFAVAPLKLLVESGYNVLSVVTVPDKPAGRGLKIQQSPVKVYAVEKGIPVLQPDKLKSPDFVEAIKQLKPDIAVVVAFRMLPKEIWSIPSLGTFNLHASLLPQYRGAAPINWAIINGESISGVTTFLIDEQIDTGNILLQKEVPILNTDNAGDLHDNLMLAGAPLVVETVNLLFSNRAKPVSQNNLNISNSLKPAPKIFKDTCKIDWTLNIDSVYNLIRGLSPYPTAWSEMEINNGTEKSITSVKIFSTDKEISNHSLKAGTIVTDGKKQLKVACSNGFIAIKNIQLAGKKRLSIDEFLRGTQNLKLIRML
ncbi:MAG: methionyl-tRNA formyltransferase [Bacteroidales bacterium]|nr:methionyl-tRNA formyltransferase [Bacteroidales bacterium]HRX31799.1 methionyl-tRNA formyltransferase [Tenuifilaceae bacterium]